MSHDVHASVVSSCSSPVCHTGPMSNGAQHHPHGSEGVDPEELKDRMRKHIREVRAARSQRRQEVAAVAFADVVESEPVIAQARCVSVYAARPNEPGTGVLLERLAARGVRILIPVLGAGLRRDWAEYTGADDLLERAPGRPPEPGGPALGAAALGDADVIVAPALAVDTAGTRLGQGGGWYDRALEHARPGVPVVVLVHPEEVYDADSRPLPREAHDRPVDAVATTEGWRWLR